MPRIVIASGPRRMHQTCLAVVALLVGASTAFAAPAEHGPAVAHRATLNNPFASRQRPYPGRLVVNLHVGSLHDKGAGVTVGYRPWEFLEVKATYGYGTEHSQAAYLKLDVLPRAWLTPYVPVGYELGIADMQGGLRLWSHRVFGGAGLQARVLERFFVAGEVTTNVTVMHVLWDRSGTHDVPPSDPASVRVGCAVGVYLL